VSALHPGAGTDDLSNLVAVDSADGGSLWKANTGSAPVLFADLDGDGLPETVTPQGVLDGATGKARWENHSGHPARTGDGAVLVVGPDLDGDGWRDIFLAQVTAGEPFGHPPGVRVLIAEARSGKDGRALWRCLEPLPADVPWHPYHPELHAPVRGDLSQAALFWPSARGMPGYFVVNVDVPLPDEHDERHGQSVGRAFLFAADTGRLAHVWPGVTAEGVADLDGVGPADLYGRWRDKGIQRNKLYAVSGTSPEEWRRPGRWRVAGRWIQGPTYLTGPVPHADLAGDGVADVVLLTPGPEENAPEPLLQAYSGRDGRRLWSASPFPDEQRRRQADPKTEPGEWDPQYFRGCTWIECLDLDGNGRPVVVFVFRTYSAAGAREWTTILEGRTGKLRWQASVDGSPRPDLIHRQPDGRCALVFAGPSPKFDGGGDRVADGPAGDWLAIDSEGTVVRRWPRPEAGAPSPAPLPQGIEAREAALVPALYGL
jgi:hypothetical protein